MTSSPEPLISIILPVYNGEKYIQETVESVLNQTYKVIELIIVDDGSQDQTAKIIEDLTDSRINYYAQKNKGQSAAINHGITKVRGSILCFIDADDLWATEKLSKQLEVLNENPEALIFTFIRQFLSPEIELADKKIPDAPQPGFSKCTLMVGMAQWKKIGNFSTSLQLGEFIDWFGRAKEEGLTHHMVPETLAFRRIHKSNISSTRTDHRSDFAKILKQRIDQKRRSSTSN